MPLYKVDLHIHSCLSPCGDLTQSPRRIVEAARKRGLDGVGLADHNSSENCRPFLKIAARAGLVAFPAMELTTAEEVHILALFGDLADLGELQGKVYQRLQPGANDPERFGYQIIVDEYENVLGINPRLLLGATDMDVTTAVEYIRRYNGLAVASHVDRPAFSMTSQLGFVPAGVFDAVEVSPRGDPGAYASIGYAVIRSSDAHHPADVGKGYTVLELEALTYDELRLALRGEGGRRVAGWGPEGS